MTRADIIGLGLLVAACQGSALMSPLPLQSPADLGVPSALDVAWGPSGLFAVVSSNSDPGGRTLLVQVDPLTGKTTAVPTDNGGCDSSSALTPSASRDNHVYYVRVCYPGGTEISLFQLDLTSAKSNEIIPSMGFPSNAYVSTDEGSTWFASDSSGLCAWVDRLTGTGGPWPITIRDGPHTFQLDDGRSPRDCDHTPLASHIALLPDRSVAFLASPASLELSGAARLDALWNLYTADSSGNVSRIAEGFSRPTQLLWNASTESFELSARRGPQVGLWSVSPSGTISLIIEAPILRFALSPDDHRIAAVVRNGSGTETPLWLWIVP